MSIITLLRDVVLFALAVYIVRLIPDATAQRIITAILVVLFVIFIVDAFLGGFGSIGTMHVGRR
jgi:hypothetical protein